MNINKRIVVILGMHRSGTSVLARGLQALGATFGDNLLESNKWNPKGYFEHTGIVELNDMLLESVGKRWDSLGLPPPQAAARSFEQYQEQAIALLQRDFGEVPLVGIKDPRASRLLPFWQSVFARAGLDACYVIALRNPISVARSLAARDGFRPEKSYLLWLSHMLEALKNCAGKPHVVADYDAVMAEPEKEILRIAAALQLPLAAEQRRAIGEFAGGFVSDSLRHSVHDPVAVRDDPRIAELVGKTYDLLRTLAQDKSYSAEEKAEQAREWRALEQAARDMAPIIEYLDACEDRIDALMPDAGAVQAVRARVPLPEHRPISPVPPRRSLVPPEAATCRISVVIPVYNHGRYVENAIGSVLAQTLPPSEIIIVDDGSSDDSAAVVRRICASHPEIIFWSWPNQGAHHALNAAIHRATGDFVAILNSDDGYDPERLSACVEAIRSNPTADVIATGMSFVDDRGQDIGNDWYDEALSFFRKQSELSLALFHANVFVSTSNLFIRRSAFETVGYFSKLRYAHDLEFFLRLILAGKHIHFLDRPLLAYRIHPENTIAESRARADVEVATIFAFFLYRRWLATNGDSDARRSWMEPYIRILDRKNILDLVEYVLARLSDEHRLGADVGNSIEAQFRGLLSELGADLMGRDACDSLLAQFVDARNEFLRRWEHEAGNSKLKIKLAKQEETIATLLDSFRQQERNIETLQAELQPLRDLVSVKDGNLQLQADEIHRLNDVVVRKDLELHAQVDEIHRLNDVVVQKDLGLHAQAEEIHRVRDVLAENEQQLRVQAEEIARLHGSERQLKGLLIERERDLAAIQNSNWHKLGQALRQPGLGRRKLAEIGFYFAACATPNRLKLALKPITARMKQRYRRYANPASNVAPYPIVENAMRGPARPRVLHVIANFMLGGSSRLVVDLIEGLGDAYQHKVVTSHLPVPPAYSGVDVTEFRAPKSPEDVAAFLAEYDPAIVHVHYWGDCDWWWYDIFFQAVQGRGCHVIENVNTPVQPYSAECVDRYVYVSDYVRQEFGAGSSNEATIYPGSDFELFSRTEDEPLPNDCIGMVYRLETDKLNLQSIDVFIKVVKSRPQTKAIIVGGGTFLEPYREAARQAGVIDNFEFLGYVDYTALPAVYRRLTVFVAPVWKESFGQVSPFAMNLGIPVAGYRVGGVAEIVDDDALLADPGDSDALASLIVRLLDDPERCREIGARNRVRAQSLFSVEAMKAAYRNLYDELMKAPECE